MPHAGRNHHRGWHRRSRERAAGRGCGTAGAAGEAVALPSFVCAGRPPASLAPLCQAPPLAAAAYILPVPHCMPLPSLQGSGKLRGLKCVPASDVAASEAAFHGVPLTTLQVGRLKMLRTACWPCWRCRWAAPGCTAVPRRRLGAAAAAAPEARPAHAPPPKTPPRSPALQPPQAGQRLDFYFEAADELAEDAEGSLAFMIGRQQVPQVRQGGGATEGGCNAQAMHMPSNASIGCTPAWAHMPSNPWPPAPPLPPVLQPQLHRARELAAAATTNVVLAPAAVAVPRLGGSLCVAVEVGAVQAVNGAGLLHPGLPGSDRQACNAVRQTDLCSNRWSHRCPPAAGGGVGGERGGA